MSSTTSSDIDKLKTALSSLLQINSLDDILTSFGLTTLPTAHRYGIIFGIVTFTLTVTAVVTLLVLGGSFKRIKEQSETNSATVPDAVTARKGRPLLLEWLLEAREWMVQNYTNQTTTTGTERHTDEYTTLTNLLLNVAPRGPIPDLVSETNPPPTTTTTTRYIPPGYQDNYVTAYRTCQDKPGVPMLSGLPEARFEAYARAYAGCGTRTELSYRRSYARLYEAQACRTHGSEKKFSTLFDERPYDLVGRTCRLEALETERHGETMFRLTSGDVYLENQAYDADKVWGFLDCGPFRTREEMVASRVFVREEREAAFAIVEIVTERMLGVIFLSHDDPKNLTVQLEPPIVKPTALGTVEQLEACFLLMDRLFALGYRRIQLSIDAMDAESKKLPGRLGFTQEGLLPKHLIIKEASRDSVIYGMLNSDWTKGARAFLFKKLHGAKAQRADESNNAKEGEKDEWARVLKEQKEKEQKEKEQKEKNGKGK